MTWEGVVAVFGTEDLDPSSVMLRLAAESPDFQAADLLGVFEMLKANFRTSADMRGVGVPFGASLSAHLAALQKQVAEGTRYFSDIAFRNIFRLCFEAPEPLDGMLEPQFMKAVDAVLAEAKEEVSANVRSARQVGVPRKNAMSLSVSVEFHEKIAEFRDRLSEKLNRRTPKI